MGFLLKKHKYLSVLALKKCMDNNIHTFFIRLTLQYQNSHEHVNNLPVFEIH